MRHNILTHLLFTFILALACPQFLAAQSSKDPRDKVRTPDWYDAEARKAIKSATHKDNLYMEDNRGRKRPIGKSDDWYKAKGIIDEGLKKYPNVSNLNELAGRFYFRMADYDAARYHLYKAIDDDNTNVQAKQLMVEVEDSTKNYSSAICYVNELLEVNPYWRGWWIRKIRLYEKQHNYEEADRLTHRLRQIYPNDTIVRALVDERARERFSGAKSSSNRQVMMKAMQNLVNSDQADVDDYLKTANLYLQSGDTPSALEVLGKGLIRFPDSEELVRKKIGILTASGRHGETTAFIEGLLETDPQKYAYARSIRDNLVEDRASQANDMDPYILYGKIWEQRHTKEALDYLLRISFGRGYDADALYYLQEARKMRGDTPQLLYREYLVNKRMRNDAQAQGLIERIYKLYADSIRPLEAYMDSTGGPYPDTVKYNNLYYSTEEVAEELARIKINQAKSSMQLEEYYDAISALQYVNPRHVSEETREGIFNRLYACYDKLEQWDAALAMVDTMELYSPNSNYVARRASIYHKSGYTDKALEYIADTLINLPQDSIAYQKLASTYEELAVPYIKNMIANGEAERAYRYATRLVDLVPTSIDGHRILINTAGLTHRTEEQNELLENAIALYPTDVEFAAKQAAVLDEAGQHDEALGILRQQLDAFPSNLTLISTHSSVSESTALYRIKQHTYDEAMSVTDSALYYDPGNQHLLYTKGLVYEGRHMYDSAHWYQSRYKPTDDEEKDAHRQHLKGLAARASRHTIGIEYWNGRYGHLDAITAVATIWYNYHYKRSTWAGTINYAGRDGSTDENPDYQGTGGGGVQGIVGYTHELDDGWGVGGQLGFANRYFPQIFAQISGTKVLPKDWEVGASLTYRRVDYYDRDYDWIYENPDAPDDTKGIWKFTGWNHSYRNLFQLRLLGIKTLNRFSVEGDIDAYLYSASPYFAATVRGRYMPLDDYRSVAYAFFSAGTAPEASIIDIAMPRSFTKFNFSCGAGFLYQLLPSIALGLSGTWNTFYMQDQKRTGTKEDYIDSYDYTYRNLYNFAVQLVVTF